MKTVDFSETIAACDLKVGICRQLIEIMKVCELRVNVISLPYIFSRFCVLCFIRPRYQVSVYRTIGPLVYYNSCLHVPSFPGLLYFLKNPLVSLFPLEMPM